MRPVSDAFLGAIRGPHTMIVSATLCTTYQTGAEPSGVELALMDGDVRFDASADIRASLDCTVDGTGWDPAPGGESVTPYGDELFIRRGIESAGGGQEWVALGYYRVDRIDQDDAPDGPLRIAGRDRMSRIVDGKLVSPRQYQPTATVAEVVDDLVLDIYPGAVIEFDDGTLTSGQAIDRTIVVEDDRYAALADLVMSYGKVAYFDHEGVLQIRTAPSARTPVFEVNHGEGGVLVSLARSVSTEGVFNAVVAEGEAADDRPPARAVARDMDPTSPTYWYGTFGQVPVKITSPFIKSAGQAATASASTLVRSLGLPYNVDLSMVPNPALEVLDPILVTYSDDRAAEVHVLDTLSVGLSAGAEMPATTRSAISANVTTGES